MLPTIVVPGSQRNDGGTRRAGRNVTFLDDTEVGALAEQQEAETATTQTVLSSVAMGRNSSRCAFFKFTTIEAPSASDPPHYTLMVRRCLDKQQEQLKFGCTETARVSALFRRFSCSFHRKQPNDISVDLFGTTATPTAFDAYLHSQRVMRGPCSGIDEWLSGILKEKETGIAGAGPATHTFCTAVVQATTSMQHFLSLSARCAPFVVAKLLAAQGASDLSSSTGGSFAVADDDAGESAGHAAPSASPARRRSSGGAKDSTSVLSEWHSVGERTYVLLSGGIFAHVWQNREAGRRIGSAFARLCDAVFGACPSGSIRAPVICTVEYQSFMITFALPVPIAAKCEDDSGGKSREPISQSDVVVWGGGERHVDHPLLDAQLEMVAAASGVSLSQEARERIVSSLYLGLDGRWYLADFASAISIACSTFPLGEKPVEQVESGDETWVREKEEEGDCAIVLRWSSFIAKAEPPNLPRGTPSTLLLLFLIHATEQGSRPNITAQVIIDHVSKAAALLVAKVATAVSALKRRDHRSSAPSSARVLYKVALDLFEEHECPLVMHASYLNLRFLFAVYLRCLELLLDGCVPAAPTKTTDPKRSPLLALPGDKGEVFSVLRMLFAAELSCRSMKVIHRCETELAMCGATEAAELLNRFVYCCAMRGHRTWRQVAVVAASKFLSRASGSHRSHDRQRIVSEADVSARFPGKVFSARRRADQQHIAASENSFSRECQSMIITIFLDLFAGPAVLPQLPIAVGQTTDLQSVDRVLAPVPIHVLHEATRHASHQQPRVAPSTRISLGSDAPKSSPDSWLMRLPAGLSAPVTTTDFLGAAPTALLQCIIIYMDVTLGHPGGLRFSPPARSFAPFEPVMEPVKHLGDDDEDNDDDDEDDDGGGHGRVKEGITDGVSDIRGGDLSSIAAEDPVAGRRRSSGSTSSVAPFSGFIRLHHTAVPPICAATIWKALIAGNRYLRPRAQQRTSSRAGLQIDTPQLLAQLFSTATLVVDAVSALLRDARRNHTTSPPREATATSVFRLRLLPSDAASTILDADQKLAAIARECMAPPADGTSASWLSAAWACGMSLLCYSAAATLNGGCDDSATTARWLLFHMRTLFGGGSPAMGEAPMTMTFNGLSVSDAFCWRWSLLGIGRTWRCPTTLCAALFCPPMLMMSSMEETRRSLIVAPQWRRAIAAFTSTREWHRQLTELCQVATLSVRMLQADCGLFSSHSARSVFGSIVLPKVIPLLRCATRPGPELQGRAAAVAEVCAPLYLSACRSVLQGLLASPPGSGGVRPALTQAALEATSDFIDRHACLFGEDNPQTKGAFGLFLGVQLRAALHRFKLARHIEAAHRLIGALSDMGLMTAIEVEAFIRRPDFATIVGDGADALLVLRQFQSSTVTLHWAQRLLGIDASSSEAVRRVVQDRSAQDSAAMLVQRWRRSKNGTRDYPRLLQQLRSRAAIYAIGCFVGERDVRTRMLLEQLIKREDLLRSGTVVDALTFFEPTSILLATQFAVNAEWSKRCLLASCLRDVFFECVRQQLIVETHCLVEKEIDERQRQKGQEFDSRRGLFYAHIKGRIAVRHGRACERHEDNTEIARVASQGAVERASVAANDAAHLLVKHRSLWKGVAAIVKLSASAAAPAPQLPSGTNQRPLPLDPLTLGYHPRLKEERPRQLQPLSDDAKLRQELRRLEAQSVRDETRLLELRRTEAATRPSHTGEPKRLGPTLSPLRFAPGRGDDPRRPHNLQNEQPVGYSASSTRSRSEAALRRELDALVAKATADARIIDQLRHRSTT